VIVRRSEVIVRRSEVIVRRSEVIVRRSEATPHDIERFLEIRVGGEAKR
jgi:hypothetical protein